MSNYIYTNDGSIVSEDELKHYGVPGMKWGKRMARGHAGPGRYLTKKRQLAGDKKDLDYLNKGGHLSVGLTKKRQAAYDAKDKARLERRIAKNEQRLATKADKQRTRAKNRETAFVDKYKTYLNKELKKVSKDLDRPYRQEIGNGRYANWPSKRKFIEAEIQRVTSRQQSGKKLKDYYVDGKQYLLA